MIRFSCIPAASVAMALACPFAAGADQKDQATFDLDIRGFRAGVLAFSGTNDGAIYAADGRLESTGLVAFVRKIRFDATVSGRMAAGRWSPSRYEEQADTGKRRSQSLVEYRGGIPEDKIAASRENSPNYVDPATQSGTIDPMTALYAMLREVPVAEACTLNVVMFDGARRSELILGKPEPAGDNVTCAGEYRRLLGFSAKEMAEKQHFPFRLFYEPSGDGLVRVVSVTMETLYGRASLTRR